MVSLQSSSDVDESCMNPDHAATIDNKNKLVVVEYIHN